MEAVDLWTTEKIKQIAVKFIGGKRKMFGDQHISLINVKRCHQQEVVVKYKILINI
jgi:hypothetical protein